LKLEKALSLYDEGIRRFPNDTIIIDQYTDLLIQFGETAKAKEVSFLYLKTNSLLNAQFKSIRRKMARNI